VNGRGGGILLRESIKINSVVCCSSGSSKITLFYELRRRRLLVASHCHCHKTTTTEKKTRSIVKTSETWRRPHSAGHHVGIAAADSFQRATSNGGSEAKSTFKCQWILLLLLLMANKQTLVMCVQGFSLLHRLFRI